MQNKIKETILDERSIFHYLKDIQVKINFISSVVIFSVTSFNYYLIEVYISKTGSSIYKYTIIMCILDNIGTILAGVLMVWINSRTMIILTYLIVALLSIPAIFIDNSNVNGKY